MKLQFQKDSIILMPGDILETIMIEDRLNLKKDGDIAICYRKDQSGGGIEKLIIQATGKLIPKYAKTKQRVMQIMNTENVDDETQIVEDGDK
jgi:hypothetical protein